MKNQCPICDSLNTKVIFEIKHIEILYCEKCTHCFTSLTISEQTIDYSNFQQSYPESYLCSDQSEINRLARSRVKFVDKVIKKYNLPHNPKLLEIGCGYGHFLKNIKLAIPNLSSFGVEPSESCSNFAKNNFQLNVVESNFFDFDFHQKKFDVICFFHVFEHVQDVCSFLEKVRDLASDKAIVIIAVPDAETLSADMIEWGFLRHGWHLHTFSKKSLSKIVEKKGFNLLELELEPVTPMLRSSFFLVCSPNLVNKGYEEKFEAPDNVLGNMISFKKKVDLLKIRVEEFLKKHTYPSTEIWIYGGGVHTNFLIDFLDSCKEIKIIIDDDIKKNKTKLLGVSVLNLEDAKREFNPPTGIIISSLSSQEIIHKKVRQDNFFKATEIFLIY